MHVCVAAQTMVRRRHAKLSMLMELAQVKPPFAIGTIYGREASKRLTTLQAIVNHAQPVEEHVQGVLSTTSLRKRATTWTA